MQNSASLPLFARIILPLCLILLAQIKPVAVEAQQAFQPPNEAGVGQDKAARLEKLLLLQPWRVDLWEQIGYSRAANGDALGAIEALENIKDLTPQGRDQLMSLYIQVGNTSRALELSLTEIQNPQASENAFRVAISQLRKNGRYDEALQAAEHWRQNYPASSEAVYVTNVMRLGKSGNKTAEMDVKLVDNATHLQTLDEIHQVILRFDGDSDLAMQKVAIARTLAKYGEWDVARIILEEAVAIEPQYAEAWALLGEAAFQTGGDGWKFFEQAQNLNDQSAVIKVLLGIRYRQAGQPDIALVYLQEATRLEPLEARWQVETAAALVDMGRMSEALSRYLRAYEIAPGDKDIIRALVLFSGNYSIGLQEIGIPAARKLILLDDKDAESQDLMGWLLMKATDYTSAERFFHHALELDANFVQANYHLGQLYLLTNRRGDAYFHLSRVVAQLPEGEQIRISAERLLQP